MLSRKCNGPARLANDQAGRYFVYKLFGRLPGNQLGVEGSGLGLSIVLRLVKLLNLGLRVESEVGRGSVFSLEVPASAAPTADREASVKPGAPGSQSARPKIVGPCRHTARHP